MSSVPPRITYKVRAFIWSFHFGRKKKIWTTYYDCLPLEILVLAWCDFFPFCLREREKNRHILAEHWDSGKWNNKQQKLLRATNTPAISQTQTNALDINSRAASPLSACSHSLLWQFSTLSFNVVDTREPNRLNAKCSKAAYVIIVLIGLALIKESRLLLP